jgi:peroxiredoxin
MGAQDKNNRKQAGEKLQPLEFMTISEQQVSVPDPAQLTHFQFRRFAGCPVCNLHLQSFVKRQDELSAANIREVIFFHSTAEELLPHANDLPFAVVADPQKVFYKQFGVEASIYSLLNSRAWLPIARSILHSLGAVILTRKPMPSLNPEGGRYSLPADFLIANDGNIVASKYGEHVYDQWSVDELLELARNKDFR